MKFFRFFFDDQNLNSNRKSFFFKQKNSEKLQLKKNELYMYDALRPRKIFMRVLGTENMELSVCVARRSSTKIFALCARTQNLSGVLFTHLKVAVRGKVDFVVDIKTIKKEYGNLLSSFCFLFFSNSWRACRNGCIFNLLRCNYWR